jgi:hypothetical protein
MEQITIFDTEHTQSDIEEIETKNDKEIFIHELNEHGVKNAELFYDLTVHNNERVFIDSTIDVILFQQIIKYITPIIKYIPQQPPNVVSSPKKRSKAEVTPINEIGITLSVDQDITCLLNGVEIIAPKYSSIIVIGIKLYPQFQKISYPKDAISPIMQSVNFQIPGIQGEIIFTKSNIRSILKSIITAIKAFRYYYDTSLLYKSIIGTSFFRQDVSKPITTIKCSQFVNNFSKLLGINTCYGNVVNISNNIFNIGYYDYYSKLCLTGNKIFYDELKYEYDKKKEREKADASLLARWLELIQKSKISIASFGIDTGLSDKQIKTVEQKYKKLLSAKTVPEIQLANSLNDAIRSRDRPEIKKLVAKLTSSAAKTIELYPAQYIVKDNINIICYHVIAKARLLLKDYKDLIEEDSIIREILIAEYGSVANDGYFCKVCGEKISESHDTDGMTVESKLEYSTSNLDKLYLAIRKEVIFVINNFVNFGGEHKYSLMDLVTNLTTVLRPKIYSIEATLLKIKTISQENLVETLNIYMYIYIFAFITRLIYIDNSITFIQAMFTGGDGNESDGSESPFIDGGESDGSESPFIDGGESDGSESPFIDGNESDGSESPFIDGCDSDSESDDSESPFIVGGKVEPRKQKTQSNFEKVLVTNVKNSKQNAKRLQIIINIALNILIKLKRNEIQRSKIIKMDNIRIIFLDAYTWIKDIKYTVSTVSTKSDWESNNNLLDYLFYGYNKTAPPSEKNNYEKVLGKTKEQLDANPKSIYDNIQKPKPWGEDPYYYESLMSVYDYVNDGLCLENVSNSQALEEYYKKYNHLLIIDEENRKKNKRLSPLISIPYIKYIPDISNVKFQSCKDSDYIYKKMDKHGNLTKETLVLQANEIKTWLEDRDYKKIAEFKQWYLTEVICKGDHHAKGNHKILAFYNFYKNRCPIDNLHDFSANDQCTKCGVSQQKMVNLDTTYYNKYVPAYDKFKKVDREEGMLMKQKERKEKQVEFPKWVITNKPVIKLGLLLKVSPNAINNIGMYEKQEYDKDRFEKGTLHIDTPEGFIKLSNNLFDYYLFVIKSYYKLRNSEFLIDVPIFIKKFLIKYSNVNLSTKLEFINKDFLAKYAYYKRKLTPDAFSNFLLNSIAETLLTIASMFEAKSMKVMGIEFVQLLFNEIIMFEKHLTIYTAKKISYDESSEEQYFESNEDDLLDTDPGAEIDIGAISEDYEVVDSFSIADMDVENDEENLYKDVADKLT